MQMTNLSEIAQEMAQKATEYASNGHSDSKIDNPDKIVVSSNGVYCPKCRDNSGFIDVILDSGEKAVKLCSCRKVRESLQRIKQSGLADAIKNQTFESYIATEKWQKTIKHIAEGYAQSGEGCWFFIGGQSGSGKTHLCTAISGKLLNSGKALKYMLWCDESTKLKGVVNESDERDKLMAELKNVDVLYIDDFLKTIRGTNPSSADVKLAFELLNYRYVNKKMTIISSERVSADIVDIDEALGSRIVAMSSAQGFCIDLGNDRAKNYRLKPHTPTPNKQIDIWSKQ